MNHMPCSISGLLTTDDITEHEDEEVRDATTQEDFPDDLIRALMDIGRSVDQLKHLPFARKQG